MCSWEFGKALSSIRQPASYLYISPKVAAELFDCWKYVPTSKKTIYIYIFILVYKIKLQMQNKNKTRSIHCLSSHRTGFKDGCCIYIYVYIEFKRLFKITIIYIKSKMLYDWQIYLKKIQFNQLYIYIYSVVQKTNVYIYKTKARMILQTNCFSNVSYTYISFKCRIRIECVLYIAFNHTELDSKMVVVYKYIYIYWIQMIV